MKLNPISLFVLLLFSFVLGSLPSQAQNLSQRPSAITSTNSNQAGDWSKFPKTETEFMQGCVGQKNLQPSQRRAKQSFCQCAFNAYKTRYTPQTFSQINVLATQVGQNGPRLVNLMMKPELNSCSNQTNYRP
jgi:hypothetical protein